MVSLSSNNRMVAIVCAFALFLNQQGLALAFGPLVDTGVSELSPNGKHVAVNVPLFFNMVLDTRGPFKGARMSQSVLSGFVKINLDRKLGNDQKFHGPIKVEVGGMTVYNNGETAPTD